MSRDLLMHVGVYSHRKVQFFSATSLHNKEYMKSINTLAKTLDDIIVEIVRETMVEKSTECSRPAADRLSSEFEI